MRGSIDFNDYLRSLDLDDPKEYDPRIYFGERFDLLHDAGWGRLGELWWRKLKSDESNSSPIVPSNR